MLLFVDARAAENLSAVRSHLGQRLLHFLKGRLVDEGADEHVFLRDRIADPNRGIDLLQSGDERIINGAMNEQPAEGSATLASRADGGEGDGAKGEIKIRRRADDRRVVAAKFENALGKPLGQAWPDHSAHRA
jgi:hypothetical protein